MTEQAPILSVLIVTYRSQSEIRDCLGSIPRRLQDRPVEVIVVDNASPDRTGDVVRAEFPWVTFIGSPTNLGFSKANNLAYEHARGDFILFLNPDTISNEAAFTHCLQRLQQDPRIGVISPRLETLDGQMDLACRRSIPTTWDGFFRASGLASRFPRVRMFAGYNLTHLPENGTYEVGAVNGAFMMCPRRVLLRVGIFDEQFFMYGDDLDLCYRIHQAGYHIIYDGRVNMTHLKGVSSAKDADKMAEAVFTGTKQFYLKHFNPYGSGFVVLKYNTLFGLWRRLSRFKARLKGYQRARPL